MTRIRLDDENALVIRKKTKYKTIRPKSSKLYSETISEILIETKNKIFCIGICFSDIAKSIKEWVKYYPSCIIFFRENTITGLCEIKYVFDIDEMKALYLSKNEVEEKYNIILPENVKENGVKQKALKLK